MSSPDDITRMLRDVESGQAGAVDRLMESVYADLERVAGHHMRERFGAGLPGVTLEPAALVNESFMKLIRQRNKFDNRGHFFAIATTIMLRVLVDYQRSRGAAKRGGDRKRITLSLDGRSGPPAAAHDSAGAAEGTDADADRTIEVDALVVALDRLEQQDQRKADVVKLRVVWGLEMAEIAESLGISLATVERDWSFSKAWLAREADTIRDEPVESPVSGAARGPDASSGSSESGEPDEPGEAGEAI